MGGGRLEEGENGVNPNLRFVFCACCCCCCCCCLSLFSRPQVLYIYIYFFIHSIHSFSFPHMGVRKTKNNNKDSLYISLWFFFVCLLQTF